MYHALRSPRFGKCASDACSVTRNRDREDRSGRRDPVRPSRSNRGKREADVDRARARWVVPHGHTHRILLSRQAFGSPRVTVSSAADAGMFSSALLKLVLPPGGMLLAGGGIVQL